MTCEAKEAQNAGSSQVLDDMTLEAVSAGASSIGGFLSQPAAETGKEEYELQGDISKSPITSIRGSDYIVVPSWS